MKQHPLSYLIVFLLLILFAMPMSAQRVCGKIYMKDKSNPISNDSSLIGIPKAKTHIKIFERGYSKSKNKPKKISPEETDSVCIWMRTAPQHTHTLVYYEPFGWCWQLEKAGDITVYSFCKGGYIAWGNGGMSPRKKHELIVVKANKSVPFKDTHKMADQKFRLIIADLVKEDPILYDKILNSNRRRDITIRMLGEYKP